MRIFALILSLFIAFTAIADQSANSSQNLSSTIASTNVFQQVQKVQTSRQGCLIQNNSTAGNQMWVYIGSGSGSGQVCANATKGGSIGLAGGTTTVPGQSVNCRINGSLAVQDIICITGTSGDAYTAIVQ